MSKDVFVVVGEVKGRKTNRLKDFAIYGVYRSKKKAQTVVEENSCYDEKTITTLRINRMPIK